MDYKFLFDIIHSHIDGYRKDCEEGLMTVEECNFRVEALLDLEDSLDVFIEDLIKRIDEL